jgi:hypothetical protein
MDPMEEDGIYGENPNNRTLFVDVGYSYGAFSFGAVYGMIDDARTDGGASTKGEATELDLSLGVQITENVEFELFYANVEDDYEDDGDDSGDLIAGAVSWSF